MLSRRVSHDDVDNKVIWQRTMMLHIDVMTCVISYQIFARILRCYFFICLYSSAVVEGELEFQIFHRLFKYLKTLQKRKRKVDGK